jgi:ATP-binding cassette subfamily B protein
MQTTQSITQLLARLWRHISQRRRGQFGLLLVLMIFASFTEILSVGADLPFLDALTELGRIFEHPVAQPFIKALNFSAPEQLLLPLTAVFGLAAVVVGAMRLLLLWVGFVYY